MWKFPGGSDGGPVLAGLMLSALLVLPANADSAKEAFARKDYPAASAMWRVEAAAGSADAAFGLGLIADLGLGQKADAAVALHWYLQAAAAGHAAAQFNVGVMLDAGTGAPRDQQSAAVWYARAAAGGNLRAAFNLGMLYESGSGVPQNTDLARYWYAQAASQLAAARDRLRSLRDTAAKQRSAAVPAPLSGTIAGPAGSAFAELVWTASPGPDGSAFLVELAREVPDGPETVLVRRTEGSAIRIDLPNTDGRFVWRVGRVIADNLPFALGKWQIVGDGTPGPSIPHVADVMAARITIYVNAGDLPARAFAAELAATFSQAGLQVALREAPQPAVTTTVIYRYASDADLAASVADFLPVLTGTDAVARPDPGIAPGEVSIWLVGGPRSPGHKG